MPTMNTLLTCMRLMATAVGDLVFILYAEFVQRLIYEKPGPTDEQAEQILTPQMSGPGWGFGF